MVFLKTKKQKEKIIIQDYINNIKSIHHKDSIYYQSKLHLINILEWLLAYYEDRTVSTPETYLEAMIRAANHNKLNQEQIRLLYFWIYKKEIIGF
jgi:hypothetical protein